MHRFAASAVVAGADSCAIRISKGKAAKSSCSKICWRKSCNAPVIKLNYKKLILKIIFLKKKQLAKSEQKNTYGN